MKTSTASLLPLVVTAAILVGCGQHASAASIDPSGTLASPTIAPPPEQGRDPVAPAPTDAVAGAVVRDVGFELRATAAGPYHAGQPASFGVTLTPSGGYHVNEEYPIRVAATAPPELTLPKSTLARADAAEFGPQRARFDVPFTAVGAGQRRVTATVGFAVCTPERCMPDERTLALVLPIVE